MKGIFKLNDVSDLLIKLRSEFELLKKEPVNAYTAWNFFVTAEHLLDWLYPGLAGREQRERERKDEVLLQICSHIATGAKHFIPEAKHHQSVADTGSTGYFPTGWFAKNYFPDGYNPGVLYVRLEGDARGKLGKHISVVELADKVLAYWEAHGGIKPKAP